jgi:hypothetical protein
VDEITDHTYLNCQYPIEIDYIWKSSVLPVIRAAAPENRRRGILKPDCGQTGMGKRKLS